MKRMIVLLVIVIIAVVVGYFIEKSTPLVEQQMIVESTTDSSEPSPHKRITAPMKEKEVITFQKEDQVITTKSGLTIQYLGNTAVPLYKFEELRFGLGDGRYTPPVKFSESARVDEYEGYVITLESKSPLVFSVTQKSMSPEFTKYITLGTFLPEMKGTLSEETIMLPENYIGKELMNELAKGATFLWGTAEDLASVIKSPDGISFETDYTKAVHPVLSVQLVKGSADPSGHLLDAGGVRFTADKSAEHIFQNRDDVPVVVLASKLYLYSLDNSSVMKVEVHGADAAANKTFWESFVDGIDIRDSMRSDPDGEMVELDEIGKTVKTKNALSIIYNNSRREEIEGENGERSTQWITVSTMGQEQTKLMFSYPDIVKTYGDYTITREGEFPLRFSVSKK